MKTEFLKTLWHLRFEKLRKNEEEAAWKYQEILEECLMSLPKKDPVNAILMQLIHEERGHEKLAEELLQICHLTHPECA